MGIALVTFIQTFKIFFSQPKKYPSFHNECTPNKKWSFPGAPQVDFLQIPAVLTLDQLTRGHYFLTSLFLCFVLSLKQIWGLGRKKLARIHYKIYVQKNRNFHYLKYPVSGAQSFPSQMCFFSARELRAKYTHQGDQFQQLGYKCILSCCLMSFHNV